MWGRAGRRGRGLAIYVAGEDALDQFFCRHPDEFLERPVEAAILDPARTSSSTPRTCCAPRTRAARPRGRREILGPTLARARPTQLVGRGRAAPPAPTARTRCVAGRVPGGARCRCGRRGRTRVSRRSTAARARSSARSTRARAPSTVHQGAVYLHGRAARSRSAALELDDERAFVAPFDGNWYTQPKRETRHGRSRKSSLDPRETLGVRLSFGKVVRDRARCWPTSASA